MTQRMLKKQRKSQGLPDDILQLIEQRLYISDYIVSRQVCPSWRAAIDRGIVTRSCPPAPQPPWFLLLDSYGLYSGNNEAFYIENQYSFLRSPTSFKSAETETSPPSYYRCCVGSVESWLIVTISNRSTLHHFFFNPLSRARVMLPSDNLFLEEKIVASTAPDTTRRMNNCFVAALCSNYKLLICRPTDASWTLIQTRYSEVYEDIEIIDRKLYVVRIGDYNYSLLEFDILPGDDNFTRAKYSCSLNITMNLNERQYISLVKDSASKELFIVLRKSLVTNGVRVYKMKSNSSDGKPSCEEVTDLDDRILFLSRRSNKVINDKTLGKNCIYFAFGSIEGFWVYSLTDMSFKRVNLPKDYSSKSNFVDTLWFTPHPW